MIKDEIKAKISRLIFIVVFWMFILRQMAAMMPIVPEFSDIAYIHGIKILTRGIQLLAIVIICNKPSIFEVILCVCAIGTNEISGNPILLILTFLLVAFSKLKIDKDEVVKIWMIPTSVLIVLVLVLYPILHMQGNPVAIDYCGTRWNYFFGHPNGFGLWFTFWILGILYLSRTKMPSWGMSIILFGAAVFLLLVPESKTAAVVLLLGIPLLLLGEYGWKFCKIIIYIIPVACIIVTIALTLLYYQGILLCNQYVLHPTLSMRFQDAAISLSECPLNLWGQKVYHLGESILFYGILRHDVSLDNGIIAVLIYYGVILGVLFLMFFVASIFKMVGKEDKKHKMQVIFMILTFVMGMMELPAWYGTIGFPMFFLGDWIRSDDKKKSKIT